MDSARSHSLQSTFSVDDGSPKYEPSKLYHAVLKVVLLEYICEARFYQAPAAPVADRKSRLVKPETDTRLPPQLLAELKTKLHDIAIKRLLAKTPKRGAYDDNTRRLLLRFYGDLLDPRYHAELEKANSIDVLVMRFVAAANKEIVKLNTVPVDEVSAVVFRQAECFIDIVLQLVQKDKNKDALLAKLNEHRLLLRPGPPGLPRLHLPTKLASLPNAVYPTPSYAVADMDLPTLALVQAVFEKSPLDLQADINTLKPVVSQKLFAKDIEQVQFYLGKDIGRFSPASFASEDAYQAWKTRETDACTRLLQKYHVPPHKKLLPAPPLPPGEELYIVPLRTLARPFFTDLCRLTLLHCRGDGDSLLTNKARDLLLLCARVWRLDVPSRTACLFAAAHILGLVLDPLFGDSAKEVGPIDLEALTAVFQCCKRWIEDGKLDWEEKHQWALPDQDLWAKYLGYSYSEVFHSIRDCLSSVAGPVKPKFAPYLNFLADYIESDSLFSRVEESGLPKKWEKRLSRTIMRTAEALYATFLKTLPRDDTISLMHVMDIAEQLVKTIKLLQSRYKQPLLGFLDVSKTYAAVVTCMFASDSQNILNHICGNLTKRGEFLNYGDALEVYKELSEIRLVHKQVSKTAFPFPLEDFFYPYLESWLSESSQKIKDFVTSALAEDDFQSMDPENGKMHSTLVHDIFSLIKQYLSILKGLNWADEYQLAMASTYLIQSISSCCLVYATEISNIITNELREEVKTVQDASWFAEMKNMVNKGAEKWEPYHFLARTCIGLNNLNAMANHLAKLEELVDPEHVLLITNTRNPGAQKFTSHVFSIRVVKAENLTSAESNLRPYLTLVDILAKKMVARTRTMLSANPEWDEEYELTIPANTAMTVSATVWDEKFGSHSVCGRALIQLEPHKFKHDGVPQEVFLDLDPEGRVLIEIAVESEREDAMFAMGRAHRVLKRAQERITKLIVAKFTKFIQLCFSRHALKSVCGASGNIKPTEQQMDEAMLPLYDYLNMNLKVLAQNLTNDLLLQVMLEAWNVIVASADELLLPKLTSSRALKVLRNSTSSFKTGWQSAVTSAVANVTSTLNQLGFGKTLTTNEIETVIAWLHFLCFDFFYNNGNGPPVHDLKTEKYQSLLLIPVYYDIGVHELKAEVERLSPAFLQTLRDKNNVFVSGRDSNEVAQLRSRRGSIARSLTIRANATARAREEAKKEARQLLSDPLQAQTAAENIILRLLLIRDEKMYVCRRLEQRERLAHAIATERLARAAAEGNLFK